MTYVLKNATFFPFHIFEIVALSMSPIARQPSMESLIRLEHFILVVDVLDVYGYINAG